MNTDEAGSTAAEAEAIVERADDPRIIGCFAMYAVISNFVPENM